MSTRRNVSRIAAVTLLLVAVGSAALAQVTTGTISGTVKDTSGGAVPGATVTVTEINKGTSSTFVTDSEGSYSAPFLIPGTYEVAIELTGFGKSLRRKYHVTNTVTGLHAVLRTSAAFLESR